MPLVSRTRATLRSAEFGFFGVWVYTRVQTPRFCGQDCSAGLAVLYFGAVRPLRTSWLNVGTLRSSFFRSSGQLWTGITSVISRRHSAAPLARGISSAAQRSSQLGDWAATHCPYFPVKRQSRGMLVSDQIRRTTVAPQSFRKPA